MHQVVRQGLWLSFGLAAAASVLLILQATDPVWWLVRVPGVAALILTVAAVALAPNITRQKWHRRLGLIAIAALCAHVFLMVALEPTLWRWLSPAMPVEIIAGLVAAAFLLVTLTVRRSRLVRSRLGAIASLGFHKLAGLFACIAAAAHIALSAGMAASVIVLLGTLVALLLCASLGFRKQGIVLAIITVLSAGILAGISVGPVSQQRLAELRVSPVDHARFVHADHSGFTCTSCHHNFVDRTGTQNCITCHKQLTLTESMRVDRLFHAFCGDCHREERQARRDTGPIDHCAGCHI